jgi:hypothetical protein
MILSIYFPKIGRFVILLLDLASTATLGFTFPDFEVP